MFQAIAQVILLQVHPAAQAAVQTAAQVCIKNGSNVHLVTEPEKTVLQQTMHLVMKKIQASLGAIFARSMITDIPMITVTYVMAREVGKNGLKTKVGILEKYK